VKIPERTYGQILQESKGTTTSNAKMTFYVVTISLPHGS